MRDSGCARNAFRFGSLARRRGQYQSRGCGKSDHTLGAGVAFSHVFPFELHTSSAAQHTPIDAPWQQVVPSGQHTETPSYPTRAVQHVV